MKNDIKKRDIDHELYKLGIVIYVLSKNVYQLGWVIKCIFTGMLHIYISCVEGWKRKNCIPIYQSPSF